MGNESGNSGHQHREEGEDGPREASRAERLRPRTWELDVWVQAYPSPIPWTRCVPVASGKSFQLPECDCKIGIMTKYTAYGHCQDDM